MSRNPSCNPTPQNAAPLHVQQTPQPHSCTHDCHSCTLLSFDAAPRDPNLRGWRLALGSMCLFVLPITVALMGAAMGDDPAQQALGGIVGLGAGMGAARGIRRLFHHLSKEHTWLQP